MQTAQNEWIARCTVQRLFGQSQQALCMEACSKTFQPHGRHLPIAVTARPAQQVDLSLCAFNERRTQFTHQLGVMPRSGSQICVERTTFIGHVTPLWAELLRRGLCARQNHDKLLE